MPAGPLRNTGRPVNGAGHGALEHAATAVGAACVAPAADAAEAGMAKVVATWVVVLAAGAPRLTVAGMAAGFVAPGPTNTC